MGIWCIKYFTNLFNSMRFLLIRVPVSNTVPLCNLNAKFAIIPLCLIANFRLIIEVISQGICVVISHGICVVISQ
jgi:hypothetical protein